MRCTSPLTVGFHSDGKTICWSPTKYSKQYAPFQLPCGKCISCRLIYSRQLAIRCVHEAQMYENNSFITLTYSEENLTSPKLQYKDFQSFIKKLRTHIFDQLLERLFPNAKTQKDKRDLYKILSTEEKKHFQEETRISVFVAGEYGDIGKRPHWHALIFNWRPNDCVYKYSNERGDKIFNSRTLETLWPNGISEIGEITFESASYCARYAAKKLKHGKDGEHDYEPIAKRSSKNAIGKKWLEKYYEDIFNNGYIILPNGQKASIPRYYEQWYKKKCPEGWEHYIKNIKSKIIQEAQAKQEKTTTEESKANFRRSALKGLAMKLLITKNKTREKILKQKFDLITKTQKL